MRDDCHRVNRYTLCSTGVPNTKPVGLCLDMVILRQISLCSLGYPRTHYVDQELAEICCFCLLSAGIKVTTAICGDDI